MLIKQYSQSIISLKVVNTIVSCARGLKIKSPDGQIWYNVRV